MGEKRPWIRKRAHEGFGEEKEGRNNVFVVLKIKEKRNNLKRKSPNSLDMHTILIGIFGMDSKPSLLKMLKIPEYNHV